jgi:hypothetical protein
MMHALRLRDAVDVTFASGILSFTDRDIELTIEIELELDERPELADFDRHKLERSAACAIRTVSGGGRQ